MRVQKNTSLTILVNATSFGSRPSGARNRFESLYPTVIRSQPNSRFTLLVSKDYVLPPEIHALETVRIFRLPFNSTNKHLRRLFFLMLPLLSLGLPSFDIVDDLSQPPTLLRSRRRMLTIHDIRRLDISSNPASRYGYRVSLWLCRLLDANVVTVSEAMAKRLSAHYPERLTHVVENSVPKAFLMDYEIATDTTIASSSYILAVGHIEKRKNYVNLIEAFSQLSDRWPALCLIIVGKDNGSEKFVRNLIAERGLQDRVKLFAEISDPELVLLYQPARLMVFPSIYEGFGIPLLEAMATDCPMSISDIDVFHEIAEEAALYFNPNDINDICAKIDTLLASEQMRLELVAKGRQRLERYSSTQLASKLVALYRPHYSEE
jgi:glycosyltransferase involved in cell wall biosynthesis